MGHTTQTLFLTFRLFDCWHRSANGEQADPQTRSRLLRQHAPDPAILRKAMAGSGMMFAPPHVKKAAARAQKRREQRRLAVERRRQRDRKKRTRVQRQQRHATRVAARELQRMEQQAAVADDGVPPESATQQSKDPATHHVQPPSGGSLRELEALLQAHARDGTRQRAWSDGGDSGGRASATDPGSHAESDAGCDNAQLDSCEAEINEAHSGGSRDREGGVLIDGEERHAKTAFLAYQADVMARRLPRPTSGDPHAAARRAVHQSPLVSGILVPHSRGRQQRQGSDRSAPLAPHPPARRASSARRFAAGASSSHRLTRRPPSAAAAISQEGEGVFHSPGGTRVLKAPGGGGGDDQTQRRVYVRPPSHRPSRATFNRRPHSAQASASSTHSVTRDTRDSPSFREAQGTEACTAVQQRRRTVARPWSASHASRYPTGSVRSAAARAAAEAETRSRALASRRGKVRPRRTSTGAVGAGRYRRPTSARRRPRSAHANSARDTAWLRAVGLGAHGGSQGVAPARARSALSRRAPQLSSGVSLVPRTVDTVGMDLFVAVPTTAVL